MKYVALNPQNMIEGAISLVKQKSDIPYQPPPITVRDGKVIGSTDDIGIINAKQEMFYSIMETFANDIQIHLDEKFQFIFNTEWIETEDTICITLKFKQYPYTENLP